MREQSEAGDDVVTTPYHAKVYTDAPATRSPILTVILAIVILAILTLGALAALHWFQRRSATSNEASQRLLVVRVGLPGNPRTGVAELVVWKTDYEEVLQ
ncbi:MAG: hypothetical protein ACR2G5_06570 [Pyrinomonadaceae bacterium]